MIFESFSSMFSNFNDLNKVLFLVAFGIPLIIFIYHLGKNIGRTVSVIADVIKKIQSGNEK